ncbi:hypothetical protein WJX73_004093 [Symbiochloris irregularis]|uniref:Rieske domain-containing protein n=1 Tax=Symbiochloris irregularis TaxID=706552 RepID=A0AAW1PKD4_9CHLO
MKSLSGLRQSAIGISLPSKRQVELPARFAKISSQRLGRAQERSVFLSVKAAAAKASAATAQPGLAESAWAEAESVSTTSYPQLTLSGTADVVIVGAGIAGLTTAYHLCKAGRKVVVLESQTVGSGQTGRSAAHLTAWPDAGLAAVGEEFGLPTASLLADAQSYSIQTIEQIIKAESIECSWQPVNGYLYPHDEARKSFQAIEAELKAAQKAGISNAELVDLGGSSKVAGIRKAVKFPGCANINPLAYAQGLAAAVQRLGGVIHEESPAQTPEGTAVSCKATGASIVAQNIVLATNSPIHRNLVVHSRQHAFRTYIIGLKVKEGSVEDAQFWDTAEPHHYMRLVRGAADGDVVLVGGAGHAAGQDPSTIGDRFASLEQWARRRLPQAQNVVYRWAGQAYEPVDRIPLYGQDPINAIQKAGTHYVATGHGNQDITGGTIAGRVISDQILGYTNPWTKVFAPARLPSASVDTALKEASVLLDVSKGYLRNVLPVETSIKRVQDLAPGTGAVLTTAPGKVVAAYVDPDGKQHVRTAVCKHFGCVVQWNPTDETFNCPCHGAGYDKYGKLIQGPATSDLAPL